MSNDTETGNVTELRNPVYALAFGSIVTLGLPLNAVSLWILLSRHSLKSSSAVFMINLMISDLLLIISLPLRVYYYATGKRPWSDMVCIWVTMLLHNNIRSSSIFITFISIDRLLAVVLPLRSRHLRTCSKASKVATFIWVAVFTVNIPESVAFSRYLSSHSNTTCFEFSIWRDYWLQLAYLQPVLVLILLAVNVVSIALVSWTLCWRRRRDSGSDSGQVHNQGKLVLIFGLNLMMFAMFFLPVSLAVLVKKGELTSLVCLACVNCCLDPLLYYFCFDRFLKPKEDASI